MRTKSSRGHWLWAVAAPASLSLASLAIGSGGTAQGLSAGGSDGAHVTAVPSAKQTTNLEARKVADEIEALAWIASGDYYERVLESAYPNGSKGQVYKGEYNMTGSKDGINATVRMRAAYTNEELYLQIEWQDPTGQNDLHRRRFLFNGPGEGGVGLVAGWSSQLNDDKFGLAFDINGAADARGTFEQNGCTTACHGSMNPAQGAVDIWHWKASRSNPRGFVNDQWADSAGRKNDAGDPIEVRNWKVKDDISQGPLYAWDSTKGKQVVTLANPAEGSVTLDPATFLIKERMMELRGDAVAGDAILAKTCQSCHSGPEVQTLFAQLALFRTDAEIRDFTTAPDHPGADVVAGVTDADWPHLIARIRAVRGVPGYYLQNPTGSNADLVVLNSKTVFSNGKYTVQVRRRLETGYPDDVQFTPVTKKEYVFGVAVMDKDGKNHAGWAREILRFLD